MKKIKISILIFLWLILTMAVLRPCIAQYRSVIGNIWVGTNLYLATDKTYIGKVVDIESNHRFSDGTIRDAVKINFANGQTFWMPRETVKMIYVTRD
jgi:hypothetical protein